MAQLRKENSTDLTRSSMILYEEMEGGEGGDSGEGQRARGLKFDIRKSVNNDSTCKVKKHVI